MTSLVNQDEAILDQMASIEAEIKAEPMVGDVITLSTLLPEYEQSDNPFYAVGIKYLETKYSGYRRVRRDGNCFYRAFLYQYLDKVLSAMKTDNCDAATAELARLSAFIVSSKDELIESGFPDFAFEFFYDEIIELLERLPTMTGDELFAEFQEQGNSNSYTWYMRLLTSGSMRRQADRFLPFIDDVCAMTGDMAAYVAREVEPMGKECEQVQIIALTEYIGVPVKIEYLDGRNFDPTTGLNYYETEVFSCDKRFGVVLLYRPGHYDILYSLAI